MTDLKVKKKDYQYKKFSFQPEATFFVQKEECKHFNFSYFVSVSILFM